MTTESPKTEKTRAGLRLVAPLLAAALVFGPASAWASDTGAANVAADEEQEALLSAVRELLAPLGTPTGPEPAAVATRLAALGPEAIPVLFEMASNGFAGPGGNERREAVRGAFGRLPAQLVFAHLRSVATGDDAGLAPRLRAMEIMGAAAGKDALPLLLEITSGISSRQMKSQAVEARLRPALVNLLRADARGYRVVEAGWDEFDGALREIALAAIESIGRRASVRSLGRLLGKDDSTNLSILRRLGRIPLTGPDELGDTALYELERLLSDESVPVRRAAAHLIGRFRHLSALDDLMKHLDDDDAGVRAAAAGSLRRLTGLSLGDGEAARWRDWIEGERAWRANECPAELRKLQDKDIAVRRVALRSLARHRLHAETLWQPVAASLEMPDAELRAEACRTLGNLRAPAALERLVEALSDPEPTVVEAAQAALADSTGRPSPGDAAAWTSLLDLDRGIWD